MMSAVVSLSFTGTNWYDTFSLISILLNVMFEIRFSGEVCEAEEDTQQQNAAHLQ